MSDSSPPPDARSPRNVGKVLRLAAGSVTAVALLVAMVSSTVLVRRFRPDLQVDDIHAVAEVQFRYAPRAWVTVHEMALNLSVVSALLWATVTAVTAARSSAVAVRLVAAAVAVVGSIVASLTWGLVRWDQVALWAVTVGESFSGLWKPAVSDDVRFLIIGGAEVGQSTYLRALVIHLGAPVVAAVALLAAEWIGRDRPARAADEPGRNPDEPAGPPLSR